MRTVAIALHACVAASTAYALAVRREDIESTVASWAPCITIDTQTLGASQCARILVGIVFIGAVVFHGHRALRRRRERRTIQLTGDQDDSTEGAKGAHGERAEGGCPYS
ncbi:hypothetical protein CYLTODRAFT_423990 [Cylindrobasidium torrendii FP15055 ss-10]|uniref:Uncharacterized protein n=1 Tax=Cylindrobasidium torrendii FP15055 ss-10 TaxID=1314674 RepID=A0A0D7B5T3_9AGAR|nr:hypothetical protein CYLTODRAFT_423990 [Cylindrobasidium torrendii FP15055 ss-10]